jgi:hypothetical protein
MTALGEVGLDCREGAKPFGIQKSTLQWVLALARPYMPLVLHIRASGESPQASDIPKGLAPSLQSNPTSPKAVIAGESIGFSSNNKTLNACLLARVITGCHYT